MYIYSFTMSLINHDLHILKNNYLVLEDDMDMY